MQITPEGRPPFRAEHIGSLLRPPKLRDAFRQRADGRLGESALRAAQDEAVREVVRLQEECGLQVVNDGEFRRVSYWEKFVRLTNGLSVKQALFKFYDEHGHEAEFTAPYAEAKVGRGQPITLDEFEFVKGLTTATPKVTLPAPSTMHMYRYLDYANPRIYNDPQEFFADLGKVYQAEAIDLAQAGCRYIQLDEVGLAILCDPVARSKVRADGFDPDKLVDLYVDAINEAVRGMPPEVVVGMHICRGNYKGMYLAEGGYDSVAERLFGHARVNHFLLEFDTPRAGDFKALRYLPKCRGVVLGMVSSKTAQLESLDQLRRRVDQAAKYVDGEFLAISPQCGFASTIGGNRLTEEEERAKLRLCVEAAHAIWG